MRGVADSDHQEIGHGRAQDTAARREGNIDGADDFVELRRRVAALAHVLRLLLEPPELGHRVPVAYGLFHHGARGVHLQFCSHTQEVRNISLR